MARKYKKDDTRINMAPIMKYDFMCIRWLLSQTIRSASIFAVIASGYGYSLLYADSQYAPSGIPFTMKMECWETLQNAAYMKRVPSPDWSPLCVETWENGAPKTVEFVDPVSGWPVKRLRYYEENGQLLEEADLYSPSPGSEVAEGSEEHLRGMLDGVQILYYKSGAPYVVTTYSKGKPHGVEKRFFENGSLELSRGYVHGILEGEELLYWPFCENPSLISQRSSIESTGTLRRRQCYQKGLLHGVSTSYSPAGDKEEEATYREGVLHGKRLVWHHDDEAPYHEVSTWHFGLLHDNGKKPASVRTSLVSGKVQEERHYILGTPHGSHCTYHSNGKVKTSARYIMGKKEGELYIFDEKGNPLGGGLYINGAPQGTHRVRASYNGPILEESVYDGKGCGVHAVYASSPYHLQERFSTCHGQLDGEYKRYYPSDEDGSPQVMYALHFSQGMLDGAQKGFYHSGAPMYEYSFSSGLRDGIQKEWSKEEKPVLICSFRKGAREGKYEEWHSNRPSQLRCRTQFIEGLLDGAYEAWYENGKRAVSSVWKQGREEGNYDIWSEEGVHIAHREFSEGKLHGSFLEWYPDGTKKESAQYKQGKLVGTAQEWYENGREACRAIWHDGVLDGEVHEWFENGELAYQGLYKQGRPIGLHRHFYPRQEISFAMLSSPQVSMEESYDEQGLYDGLQTAYYSNGKIKTQASYSHGQLNGKKERFSENGELLFTATYQQGLLDGRYYQVFQDGMREERLYERGLPSGVWTTWYAPSSEEKRDIIAAQARYINGRLEGEYREYFPNGNVALIIPFVQGLRNGLAVIYDTEGRVSITTKYVSGEQDGDMIIYYPSGAIMRTSVFSHGALHGESVSFFESGAKKTYATYDKGLLDGEVYEWAEDGTLLFEGVYQQGRRHGIFRKFALDGTLKAEMYYKDGTLVMRKGGSNTYK